MVALCLGVVPGSGNVVAGWLSLPFFCTSDTLIPRGGAYPWEKWRERRTPPIQM